MFKVEKGIEIPKKSFKGRRSFPFDKMEVGDSFFVPLEDGRKLSSLQSSLATCARMYSDYNKKEWKFTTKSSDDGVRIWRIK